MKKSSEFLTSMVVRALGTRPSIWVGSKLFAAYVPILMLHRFSCPALEISGHDASFLRWALEYLRKRKFNFVSVEEIARAVRDNEPLPPQSIAFSLDDGYWDQTEAGGRLFAAYDCPATYFIATGFIDGDIWPWDAKVEYAISNCSEKALRSFVSSTSVASPNSFDRSSLASQMIEELKSCNADAVALKIRQWADALDVEIPQQAPERDAPTTWDRLRDLQRMGMHVGPHTRSHPILSQESIQVARREVRESRDDLSQKLGEYANVFCYPVGRREDFGQREVGIVEEMKFIGAVSAVPGTVNQNNRDGLFAMPRYGFPDSEKDLIQYASWIEAFKGRVRGG